MSSWVKFIGDSNKARFRKEGRRPAERETLVAEGWREDRFGKRRLARWTSTPELPPGDRDRTPGLAVRSFLRVRPRA
jgi:hypothetical protein